MTESGEPVRLSVETVSAFLRDHGLAVQTMPADTSTAVAAADTLGTQVAAIAKSLVFMDGDTPVLALVAGDRRADPVRLAAALDTTAVRLARPGEVLAETGYTVGGVPPVAHRRPLRVVMDRYLMDLPVIYAAAGSGVAIFAVEPDHLRRLAHATVTDFTD